MIAPGRVDLWWADVAGADPRAQRRALLRDLLARYLDCDPEDVVLRRGASGRPELERPRSRLRFSASSSGAVALFAVTDGAAIGVDVERSAHGAGLDAAQHLFLSAAQRRAVAGLAADARPAALLRHWTLKEALAKAMGTGLPDDPAGLVLRPPWRGGPIATAGDVVAALVVEGGWEECRQRRLVGPLQERPPTQRAMSPCAAFRGVGARPRPASASASARPASSGGWSATPPRPACP